MQPVPSMVPLADLAPVPAQPSRGRWWLGLSTFSALALAAALGPGRGAALDPDLVRLLRFMALLKGAFASVALTAAWWRLGRPAASWRAIVYVVGPALMTGGAVCLWTLQSVGIAALGLHVGLFALLAAGLTDADFIPAMRRREG